MRKRGFKSLPAQQKKPSKEDFNLIWGGDGIKSEPEMLSKNLLLIRNMILRVKSAEYYVLELKMQMVNVA